MKGLSSSSIIVVLCTAIYSTRAQNVARCGLGKFRCQNGECIAGVLLCDGKADCKDRSDETRFECNKSDIMCSEYAFRCAYGACVDGDAPCNGVQDCLDNSDETLPRCTSLQSNDTVVSTDCSTNQFRCDNGQCIESTALCDGSPDCSDRSDETITKCGSYNCPQTVFRCNYGACIDGDLKCNGVINCADGSDEDPKLCGGSVTLPGVPTPPTRPRPVTPTSSSPSWPTESTPSCLAPPQPENGNRELDRSLCQSRPNCYVEEGAQLKPGAFLNYTCNPGYRIKGSNQAFCGAKGQWLNIPVCVEIRCMPLSSASIRAECLFNNNWISCASPVPPQTTAKLSCQTSYREDTSLLSRQRENVRCNENGEWDPEPIRCIPECGVINPTPKPLIVNGTLPNITDFPWHATLYRAERPEDKKLFTCGASIIQDNLLITAAHCVYDEPNQRVESPDKFYIATGNLFQDYDYPFHDSRIVKKAKVKNIYIICSYLGLEGNYAWDIAILEIVEPFVFSSLLLPVCLDRSASSDQSVLEVGNIGRVAGFGRTHTGEFSAILQSVNLPYVPLNQCKSSSVVDDAEKLITIDKFCAGYTNGSSVCDGDSGGGLVFKSGRLWYLRGIVSASIGATLIGGERSCNSHQYSLFTRVSSHIGWIQDVILRLERFKSYPSCPTQRSDFRRGE